MKFLFFDYEISEYLGGDANLMELEIADECKDEAWNIIQQIFKNKEKLEQYDYYCPDSCDEKIYITRDETSLFLGYIICKLKKVSAIKEVILIDADKKIYSDFEDFESCEDKLSGRNAFARFFKAKVNESDKSLLLANDCYSGMISKVYEKNKTYDFANSEGILTINDKKDIKLYKCQNCGQIVKNDDEMGKRIYSLIYFHIGEEDGYKGFYYLADNGIWPFIAIKKLENDTFELKFKDAAAHFIKDISGIKKIDSNNEWFNVCNEFYSWLEKEEYDNISYNAGKMCDIFSKIFFEGFIELYIETCNAQNIVAEKGNFILKDQATEFIFYPNVNDKSIKYLAKGEYSDASEIYLRHLLFNECGKLIIDKSKENDTPFVLEIDLKLRELVLKIKRDALVKLQQRNKERESVDNFISSGEDTISLSENDTNLNEEIEIKKSLRVINYVLGLDKQIEMWEIKPGELLNDKKLGLCFEPLSVCKQILEQKNLFEKIIDRIQNDSDLINFLTNSNSVKERFEEEQDILEHIYPSDSDLVPNFALVQKVYEIKRKIEVDDNKGKYIPNVAIMGEPGTGKTTISKKIAQCLGFAGIIEKSASSLKGQYVGHTERRTYDAIKEAADKNKVLFIDEAYHLQSDQYGREAVDMLLPLMSGDKKEMEKRDKDDNNDDKNYVTIFTKDNNEYEKIKSEINITNLEIERSDAVPPIWFAGYEDELRTMLSRNSGLYRRMEIIVIPTPSINDLYGAFVKRVKELQGILDNNEKEIKEYFRWASSREHSEYFGNYAGVDTLAEKCKVRIFTDATGEYNRSELIKIIEECKSEIKKQYKVELTNSENKNKQKQFEVQSDVETVLDDIKGEDGKNTPKEKLDEIVSMIFNQEDMLRKGISIPKGALLIGPPGTGKTMLARAVAGEIKKRFENEPEKEMRIAFIPVVATELEDPARIAILFSQADEYDVTIIFIDEIDAIGRHRSENKNYKSLIQLMKEMDGFEAHKGLFVMAATNDPESLDPALKRPGRFDRVIEVSYPTILARRAILCSALKKLKVIADDKKINGEKLFNDFVDELAKATRGYTPAELNNIINEAAILYEKSAKKEKAGEIVEHRNECGDRSSEFEKFKVDVAETIERISVGELNNRGKEKDFAITVNGNNCSSTAIHEVGHGLTSILVGFEPFEKITIVSRGNALGYVVPSKNNIIITKKDYENKIMELLGGRAAEEIFYSEENVSGGARQDIKMATEYAEKMVAELGMSELGLISIKESNKSYIGNDSKYTCSETMKNKAEEQMKAIIDTQYKKVKELLLERKGIVEQLAKYVFEEETISGEIFKVIAKELLDGKTIEEAKALIKSKALEEGE